jgi:hypothetical protein
VIGVLYALFPGPQWTRATSYFRRAIAARSSEAVQKSFPATSSTSFAGSGWSSDRELAPPQLLLLAEVGMSDDHRSASEKSTDTRNAPFSTISYDPFPLVEHHRRSIAWGRHARQILGIQSMSVVSRLAKHLGKVQWTAVTGNRSGQVPSRGSITASPLRGAGVGGLQSDACGRRR